MYRSLLLWLIVSNCVAQTSPIKTFSEADFKFQIIPDEKNSLKFVKQDPLLRKWDELFKTVMIDSLKGNLQSQYPVMTNNFVYVNGIDSAFNFKNRTWSTFGSPAFKQEQDTLIFANDKFGRVKVVNTVRGKGFSYPPSITLPATKEFLFVRDGMAFLIESTRSVKTKTLHAYQVKDNKLLWTIPEVNFSWTNARLIENTLYISKDGYLNAISIANGSVKWRLKGTPRYINSRGNYLALSLEEKPGLILLNIYNDKPLILFELKTQDRIQDVLFDGDFLIVQGEYLRMLDIKQKKLLWKADWLFGFNGLTDKLGASQNFIFSVHTEDVDSYTLVFDKKTGGLKCYDASLRYLTTGKYVGKMVVLTSNNNSCLFVLEER